MSTSEGPVVIRRARAEDVDRILDLLAYYDTPRSYFEPFYLRDPSYRPSTPGWPTSKGALRHISGSTTVLSGWG